MNTISTRANGQPQYQSITQSRSAWREEMLDDLLNQMRDRQLPTDAPLAPSQDLTPLPRKGSYIDFYV